MLLKNNDIKTFFYKFFTLKKRIISVFVISLFTSFLSIALISGYAISSILTNKIQVGIKSNLNQVRLSLENNISNLNSVSLQLSAMGSVGKEMGQFLFSKQPYERSQLLRNMKDEITTISYTNPSVGLIMYYFKKTKTTLLENTVVKNEFSLQKLPLLASYYGVTYYGPHISNNNFSNQYVLSALMKVEVPSKDDVYAYVETGFKLTQNILDKDQVGVKTFHIMTDNNGRIAYSEIPKEFMVNTIFRPSDSTKDNGIEKNFYWFKSKSNQGWSIISLISKADYNKERTLWINQMFLLFIAFLIIIIIISWVLWKMVSNPLNKFNRELDWIEQGDFNTKLTLTNIPEFDSLLEKFHLMKKQILNLFLEVKNKEKLRADLEIEKLRYQINPHFLLNTLNSIHWLAVMNEEPEIDGAVLSLNKLLQYNLNKKSKSATLQEEVDAVKEYMTLQQTRYNFNYDIQIHSDNNIMNISMPRFILQPLIENSIYHGIKEDGYIHVDISAGEQVNISIQDNGAGMSPETIENLLNNEQTKQGNDGMGIGLNYVKRMLESYFEGKARLEIKSVLGKGTTIILSLPYTGVIS